MLQILLYPWPMVVKKQPNSQINKQPVSSLIPILPCCLSASGNYYEWLACCSQIRPNSSPQIISFTCFVLWYEKLIDFSSKFNFVGNLSGRQSSVEYHIKRWQQPVKIQFVKGFHWWKKEEQNRLGWKNTSAKMTHCYSPHHLTLTQQFIMQICMHAFCMQLS